MADLREDLRTLLNQHSIENTSSTPDYMLASFLLACLGAYEGTVVARDEWWGLHPGENKEQEQ